MMDDKTQEKMDSIWTDLGEEFAKERSRLENEKKELLARTERLEAEKEAMMKSGVADGDVLDLDVGGEMFRVQRGTLLLAPEESHLHAMFSGRWEESLARNAEGKIFIDMSPNVFRVILSRLRSSKLTSKPAAWGDLKTNDPDYECELKAVLQFFGLVDPVPPKPPFVMTACSPGGIEVTDGLVVTNMGSIFHAPANSYTTLPFGIAWKIHMKSVHNNNWAFAGIIGTSTPSTTSYGDATSYGWASNNEVYVGGSANQNKDGWVGWQTNDTAIFKLEHSMLKMYHARRQLSFALQIPPGTLWRVHLNLYSGGDKVEVSMATDQEIISSHLNG